VVARVIRDAGLPDGALNVVTSNRPAEVAGAFFDDPRVRKLSFTGSTAVGKELIRRSADGVKRLSLELGGHAPYIVFADAAVDHAVEQVMRSKFRNAGQTCVCANRIYVQREIHAEFVERLTIATAALVVGNGLSPGVQVGPLIDAKAVDQVERHVEDAVARGATILTGGRRVTGSGFDRGSFYAPTVLDGVAPDALMSQDETFGPVAGVSAFDNEEQVIAMANDTNFGLASYLHTRDYERLLRVAEQLEHGIVGVNTGTISYANAPFGGIKQSGYGREGGSEGIEEYLETKHVLIAGVGAAA
jgi:succinate-semialdehyde dehydrogenase/glutarate-semialdehyde dehydrogenase